MSFYIDMLNDLSKAKSREETLSILKEKISVDPNSYATEDFSTLIAKVLDYLPITDGTIAKGFCCSRPTVHRWRNSQCSPHPAMRKHIFKFFIEQIDIYLEERSIIAAYKEQNNL